MTSDHPFARAGLGPPPYRIIGVTERRGPIVYERGGVTVTIGSPGQPMGSCHYCGQGIAEIWAVRASNGNEFEVGCDCIRRASAAAKDLGDNTLDRERRRIQREQRHARDDARIAAAQERLASARDAVAAHPHPTEYRAQQGATLADWCDWMFARGGRAGKIRAARAVEQHAAE